MVHGGVQKFPIGRWATSTGDPYMTMMNPPRSAKKNILKAKEERAPVLVFYGHLHTKLSITPTIAVVATHITPHC